MDLLDEIEDISANQHNYVKNIEVQLQSETQQIPLIDEGENDDDDDDNDDEDDDEEEEEGDDDDRIGNSRPKSNVAFDPFRDDLNMVSKINQIKNRIQGKHKIGSEIVDRHEKEKPSDEITIDDTQIISKSVDYNFELPNSSIMKDSSNSSVNPLGFTFDMQGSILSTGKEVQKLPQLPIDLAELNTENDSQDINSQTQVINPTTQAYQSMQVIGNSYHDNDLQTQITSEISHPSISKTIEKTTLLQSLFMDSDSEDDQQITVPLTKEQRQEKIAQLAEIKRQDRLKREIQLEQEISKTTLTDEENDLNHEANDTVVSNINPTDKTSLKELEQAEEFINIQKRHRDIRPEFVKKNIFTKDKLISGFDSDENDDEMANSNDDVMERKLKVTSTPATSPVKQVEKPKLNGDNIDDSTSSDEEELNVLELINPKLNPPKPKEIGKNTFRAYAQKIKQSLANDTNEFILDDSDSDLEQRPNTIPSKFSNDGKELKRIPELLKEQRLVLQRKFLKKNLINKSKTGNLPNNVKKLMISGNANDSHSKSKEFQDFLIKLKKTNVKQLQANKLNNPDNLILQEIEKDEEVMGSLLEREIERARKIRKQEKLRERAKLALLGTAPEEAYESPLDEVPDSDFEGEESESQSSSGSEVDGEDSDVDTMTSKTFDKPQDNFEKVKQIGENKKNIEELRNDDTYMFESKHSDSDLLSNEEDGVVASSHEETSVKEVNRTFDRDFEVTETSELFANLGPRIEKVPTHDVLFEIDNVSSTQQIKFPELPSFDDINEVVTQKDEPTQADGSTQRDHSTTTIITTTNEYDDEDDKITPSAVQNGRNKVRLNRLEKLPEEEDEEEELMKQKIKLYEAKIRKKELELRKRRRELERKGVKNVVEGEAVESEDEWHGLGGMEGELSEEANSEDEKMIDNDFNIDLKDDEIRRKFMEEYQIKDQKQLEKLLDDIKNHKLTKRAAANGLDIEFSDEEDELLMAYRKQKRAEQLQKLLENKDLKELLKNEKLKAFFECIEEKASVINIDDDDDDDDGIDIDIDVSDEDEVDKEGPLRKKYKIQDSFVQKKLSFLMESKDDNYSQLQRKSRFQHGLDSSDEEIEDLQQLKNRSLASLATLGTKRSESPIELCNDNTSQPGVDTDVDEVDADEDKDDNEDEDDIILPCFKKPSMVKSFKLLNDNQKHGISEGKHFSGVTVNKLYKVAMGSSASISYLSKRKAHRIVIKTAKEQRLERNLDISKKNKSRVFMSTGFD